jgi:hypothetical protein
MWGRQAEAVVADSAARYLTTLVEAGAAACVDNARVRVEPLVVGDRVLPLVINDGTRGGSSVCSPYAHYLEYTLAELARRHPRLPPVALRALASPLAVLLRCGSIDRVVYVNNWLLATNPRPGLSAAEIEALTARLTARHPDSAIVFRSVNPALDPEGADALRANRYRLVRSRRVYLMDSRDPAPPRIRRRTVRLLERTPYAIVDAPEALAPHVPRLVALYRELYLGKHSPLNPRFTARFFQLTLADGLLTYRALVRDGRVDAFCAYFVTGGVMTAALLGYDRRLPTRLGLYRMAFALLLDAADGRGLVLNAGAGAGHFKLQRGAVPVEEYDAVYDHHLPARRRLAWTSLRLGVGRLGVVLARLREGRSR